MVLLNPSATLTIIREVVVTLRVAAILDEALDVEGDAPGFRVMTRVLAAAYHPKVE